MFAAKNQFLTAGVSAPTPDYLIGRSLRFRASSEAYMYTIPASTGNLTTWTWSAWVKRTPTSGVQTLLVTLNPGPSAFPYTYIDFNNNVFNFDVIDPAPTINCRAITNQVFCDPASWYHIVCVWDTTQAVASDRMRLYVNGSLITSFLSITYPALNAVSPVSTPILHYTGAAPGVPFGQFFDGYIAELRFIDGQALSPTSFGKFSSTTGAWVPIAYSGSYGTNGYYLDFSTTTSATTLCYDKSGNGNNWTPVNISVASGVNYDSMLDTPTNNYPIINPLNDDGFGGNVGDLLSNGNLKIDGGSIGGLFGLSTFAIPNYGKWYFELTPTQYNASQIVGWFGVNTGVGGTFSGLLSRVGFGGGGGYYQAGVNVNSGYFGNLNDWFGIAVDRTTLPGTVTIYINNAAPYTVNAPSGDIFFTCQVYSSGTAYVNYGQQPWHNAPPSGYVGLCTANMTAPTISNGANYFATTTYTGNGSTQTITNTVNGVSFKPDLVWIKSRNSAAYSHRLFDSIRGVNVDLQSNTSNANTSEPNSLTAFNSNGYSLGVDTTGGGVNTNAITYVGWQWKASNSATVTNTDGNVTTQVCVNTTCGFSIFTWVGNGFYINRTVGHGLGIAPKLVILKNIDTSYGPGSWSVYVYRPSDFRILFLDQNYTTPGFDWPSDPTSTVVNLPNYSSFNPNALTTIGYAFAPVVGFSSFGSYVGNGSTDGPFVYCGFSPRWIMWKRTDAIGDWIIQDTTRSTYNVSDKTLYPNLADAEASGGGYSLDILSNGFKLRNSATYANASGGTYVYTAFAECPFQYANAR